jgi:Flp pilus assembly protein TadD
LEPSNREAHYALAEALRNAGRANAAAAEFNIVTHMQRNDSGRLQVRFLNSEAERMTEAGEWDQAISNLRQSLELNKDAKTATKLGCALLSKGNTEGAVQALREALQIDPTYVWADYYLGVAFAREREFDQARQALRAALKLKPGFPEATFYLGLTYAGQRQFQEAEPYLRSAVRMRPDAAPARYYLGLVLERLGRTSEGEAELQVCHLLEPGYRP